MVSVFCGRMVSVFAGCCDRKRKIGDVIEVQFERRLRRCSDQQHDIDWSKIGSDLLEYIQKEFLSLADILRCRGVCKSWRSITKTHLSSLLNCPPSPPLILWSKELAANKAEKLAAANQPYWSFLDVLMTDGEGGNLYIPNDKKKIVAEELNGCDCVGWSHGYLLFSDREADETLYLFHPTLLSGSLVSFPLIEFTTIMDDDDDWDDDDLIKKAIMWGDDPISVSSSNGRYGIALLHQGCPTQVVFAKCGDTEFTLLGGENMCKTSYVDIISAKNYIYGVTDKLLGHCITVWDCTSTGEYDLPRKVLEFEPTFSSPCYGIRCIRLVESQGEILLVAILRPEPRRIKAMGGLDAFNKVEPICQVYKMDFNKKEWVLVNSLGDRVLFIMEFQSMSISSHEFPQYQRNSIYFRHYFLTPRRKHYLGIFNMEDGSVKVIDAKRKC